MLCLWGAGGGQRGAGRDQRPGLARGVPQPSPAPHSGRTPEVSAPPPITVSWHVHGGKVGAGSRRLSAVALLGPHAPVARVRLIPRGTPPRGTPQLLHRGARRAGLRRPLEQQEADAGTTKAEKHPLEAPRAEGSRTRLAGWGVGGGGWGGIYHRGPDWGSTNGGGFTHLNGPDAGEATGLTPLGPCVSIETESGFPLGVRFLSTPRPSALGYILELRPVSLGRAGGTFTGSVECGNRYFRRPGRSRASEPDGNWHKSRAV